MRPAPPPPPYFSGALGLSGACVAAFYTGAWEVGLPLTAASALAVAGGVWYSGHTIAAKADHIVDGPGLDEAFRRTHFFALSERNEVTSQLWERVRPQLQRGLKGRGLRGVQSAKRADLASLEAILTTHVPALRAAASKAGALYSNNGSRGGGGSGGEGEGGAATAPSLSSPPAPLQ